MSIPKKKCCIIWEAAKEDGTDSEGWQQLLYEDEFGSISIGCDLAPINFCPWCGKNIKEMP